MNPSNPYLDAFRNNGGAGNTTNFQPLSEGNTKVAPKSHGALGLIPALVSTLGAIGGGALGTLAAPGVGTAAGGVAGAGAGQAAGKAIENYLTGDKTTLGGEATQAAEGSGGQFVGGLAGKALGATVGKLAGGALSKGSSLLDNAASNQTAKAIATDLPSGTKTKGIDEVIANLKSAGLPVQPGQTLNSMDQLGKAGEGLNNIKEHLVSQGQPFQMDLGKLINEGITPQYGLGDVGTAGTEANKLAGGLRSMLTPTLYPTQDSLLTNSVHPSDALKASSDLFNSKFINDQTGPATEAAKNVRSSLIDAINKDGGVGKIISDYHTDNNPADMNYLTDAAGGNQALASSMADTLNGAKRLQDVQKGDIPYINASNIVKSAGEINANSAPIVAKTGGTGILGHGTQAGIAMMPFTHGMSAAYPLLNGAKAAVGSDAVRTGAGRALSGVGNVLDRLTGGSAGAITPSAIPGVDGVRAGGGLGATIGRLVGNTEGQSSGGAPTAPTTPPDSSSTTNDGTSTDSGSDSSDSSGSVFSPAVLQALAIRDIEENGGKNLSQISTLSSLFGPSASQQALTTEQKNEASGAQKALSTLGDFSNQLTSVGGGKGYIGGTIENLLGKSDIPGTSGAGQASALQSQRVDVATTIAGSLSPTGRPAASVIKLVLDGLPSITDPGSVAQAKIDQLTKRIQDGYFTSQEDITNPTGVSTASSASSQ